MMSKQRGGEAVVHGWSDDRAAQSKKFASDYFHYGQLTGVEQ